MRDRMVARELSTTTSETELFSSVPQRCSTSLSRSALATAGSVSVVMIGYPSAVRESMIAYLGVGAARRLSGDTSRCVANVARKAAHVTGADLRIFLLVSGQLIR